jgi:hypothetical protein
VPEGRRPDDQGRADALRNVFLERLNVFTGGIEMKQQYELLLTVTEMRTLFSHWDETSGRDLIGVNSNKIWHQNFGNCGELSKEKSKGWVVWWERIRVSIDECIITYTRRKESHMLVYFLTMLLFGLRVESPMIPAGKTISELAGDRSWVISFSAETEELKGRRMLYQECRADCRQLIRP